MRGRSLAGCSLPPLSRAFDPLRLGLVLPVLVLSACAGLKPQPPDAADWNDRLTTLQGLDDWTLNARVAFATAEDGWNGSLTWRQEREDLDLSFRGPLGVGGLRIQGQPGELIVRTAKGEELVVSDPEVELHREFGWTLPITSMRYWMLGIPDPGAEPRELVHEAGLLQQLNQRGWRVSYDSYREYEGSILPRKLVMENDEVRIRMAVSRWRFHDRDVQQR